MNALAWELVKILLMVLAIVVSIALSFRRETRLREKRCVRHGVRLSLLEQHVGLEVRPDD